MLVLSTDFQEWFTSEQSLWVVCKEGIKCGDTENALELESSANFIPAAYYKDGRHHTMKHASPRELSPDFVSTVCSIYLSLSDVYLS